MIQKETLQEIAKRAGIEVDKLQSAIASDKEESIELAKVNVFSDDELKITLDNLGTTKYKEGKLAGEEIRMKELRDMAGLQIDGYKDPAKLLEAYKSHIIKEANINPDTKVKELENKYNTLHQTYTSEKQDWEKQRSEFDGKLTETQVNYLIFETLPGKLPEGLTRDDIILIAKNRFKFETFDGKMVVKKDGEIVKDKLGNARKVEEVLSEFYIERGFMKEPGRGGGNSGSDLGDDFSLLKTPDQVIDWCMKNNIPLNKHSEYLAKAKKENKEFKVY